MKLNYFLLVAWCLMFISCSRGRDQKEALSDAPIAASIALPAKNPEKTIRQETESLEDLSKEANLSAMQAAPAAAPPQIIKTAHLEHEVGSSVEYSSYVRNLLKKYGAFIFKEDNTITDNKEQTTLVIKVPVGLFDELVAGLVTKEVKQLQRHISAEDISADIIDTRARLETRKATRDKYLEFLKAATKTEDVLKIQQEINNIQEDIESATARLDQLTGQASYSTIHLTYFEPGNGNAYSSGGRSFWGRVGGAIRNGTLFFGEIFIGLVTLWPVWLIGIILGLVIRKYSHRRKKLHGRDQ